MTCLALIMIYIKEYFEKKKEGHWGMGKYNENCPNI